MTTTATPQRWVRPMRPRDPGEDHRAATPLELFFDLCFVVAVAQAADGLHHGLAGGHPREALIYLLVFAAISWPWVNFSWFASAYDVDDVPYRLAVLVQIAGVLILAAGVPRAFEDRDFGITTLGYVVMRAGLIPQWLRAAAGDPACRRTALRYAIGVAVCQVGWVLLLALPDSSYLWGWLVLGPAELIVPVWAERAGPTPWHPNHMAERDHATGHTALAAWEAHAALTVPVAVYLLGVWALLAPYKAPGPMRTFAAPVAAVLVLATTGLDEAPLAAGAVCAVLLAAAVVNQACRPAA